jgi:hypothetical protein
MGEKHGRWILPTKHLFHARKDILHAVNLRHGTDRRLYFPSEGSRAHNKTLNIFLLFQSELSHIIIKLLLLTFIGHACDKTEWDNRLSKLFLRSSIQKQQKRLYIEYEYFLF